MARKIKNFKILNRPGGTVTIVKVAKAKKPLDKVNTKSGKTVVRIDTSQAQSAMKKAMMNFKNERISKIAWPGACPEIVDKD